MKTPIYDFLSEYAEKDASRFHMPGHKGVSRLGAERYDITEISGADVLYSPNGIIAESERNASLLFGTGHTYYSTEGATLAIRAMLYIAVATRRQKKGRAVILSPRNAHKSLIYSSALLDFDIAWLRGERRGHLCSFFFDEDEARRQLEARADIAALYVTSPDYLGGVLDIERISSLCREFDIPLIVDNAHGAYLKFLTPSRHPIDLGADMTADSAHKTLPSLTGGAYLHISKNSKRADEYTALAREALSLFASTSPSYLTLASLDLCNKYLSECYEERLDDVIGLANKYKEKLKRIGVRVIDSEPLKIVVDTANLGYYANEVSEYLKGFNIECEFSDDEYIVLMFTPDNRDSDFQKLYLAFESLEWKVPIKKESSPMPHPTVKMTAKEAVFSAKESVAVEDSEGRICASISVSCPPAIPIAVLGEVIDKEVIATLKRYKISRIEVIKND